MAQAMMFDRLALEQALDELGRRAHAEGKTVEIAIYGGSALVLLQCGNVFDPKRSFRFIES